MIIPTTPQWMIEAGFSPFFAERFWSKVTILSGENACWIWTGAKKSDGYGHIGIGPGTRKTVIAHRASWMLRFGNIPAGKLILHDCPTRDNPLCVRHLWIGTKSDNLRDAYAKGQKQQPTRKLTLTQVTSIKLLISRGEKMKSIAEQFGMSLGCIYAIKDGRAWFRM